MGISIPILDGIVKIIDKVIPDPQARADATFRALQLNQAGDFKQIETDLQLGQERDREEREAPAEE